MSKPDRVATPIAVIGMACRFPGARDVREYWSNLVNGVESIDRGQDEDRRPPGRAYIRAVGRLPGIEDFDAGHFRMSPAEATAMDPQHRVLLELSATALEDAGYLVPGDRIIGVMAGTGKNFYYRDHVAPNPVVCADLGELRVDLANEKDFLAARIAFKLGLRGAAVTVQAGCATGLAAVALACQSLAAGDCDIVLAGGVSLLMPEVDGYEYTAGGIESADGRCRAFDRSASGTVAASGAGVVVLKRDDEARADGDHRYGVIRGWAVNNDGGSRAGFTVPNVEGQEWVVRNAMRRAGIRPHQVAYVETHGTGTPIGDPIEVEALRRAFATDEARPGVCAIGSVKTNIGHTDAAAGIAGLIKALLAARSGVIPASLHYREANPEIDFAATPFYVNAATVPWPTGDSERIAGVSSFGLGGTNAHVLVAHAGDAAPTPTQRLRQVLIVSARTDEQLEEAKKLLADRLAEDGPGSDGALADVAYTLAVGRVPHARRWVGVVAGTADAVRALRVQDIRTATAPQWSLLIAGRPAELVEMVRRTLPREPLLRQALETCVQGLGLNSSTDALAGLQAPAAAALAAVACVRALQSVGAGFARIDGPPWAQPVIEWARGGQDLTTLRSVLSANRPGEETWAHDGASATVAGEGTIVVDSTFDIAATVARLWAQGVNIDWARFYHGESRRRVSLPTYPLTRRRYWLDRVSDDRTSGPPRSEVPGTEMAEVVRKVWSAVLGLETVDPAASFLDVGGDSLIAVEIGARINDMLNLDLPLDLAFQTLTLDAMIAYIEAHPRQKGNVA